MPSEPGMPGAEGTVPLCVPEIHGNEWKYIKDCLDTNWVSSVGSYVDQFEESLASFIGTAYGVATVNGTAALHIALLVAGVEPDDEVLVSALTFVAPANAIRYVGAWPVFIDAEPQYWQMDPDKVVDFLETECSFNEGQLTNKTTGRRVRAILPVHILGHPCDMDKIGSAARRYGLNIVEDSTESLGSEYRNVKAGHLGDISCFSFNGNKLITTGGGGMVLTDDEKWARRAKYLTTQAKDDPIEYIHEEIGYNYRLTNIQAAMGVAQLEQVEDFIVRKKDIARRYQEGLADLEDVTLMKAHPDTTPIYWLYTILLEPGTSPNRRQQLIRDMGKRGINVRPLWMPINCLRPYTGCQAYRIEHAIRIYNSAISLPSSVGLTDADLQRTISAVRDCVSK